MYVQEREQLFHSTSFIPLASAARLMLADLPHPLVLLCGGEDLGLSDEDVAEGSAAAALLVEAGHRAHGQGLDGQRLGVREAGLLRHHAAHVAYVPA